MPVFTNRQSAWHCKVLRIQRDSQSTLRHSPVLRGPYKEHMLNIWVPNQTGSEGRIWYRSSAKLFASTTTAPVKGMHILWHQTHCVFRKQFYKRQCRGMRREMEQSGCQDSSQKHRWGHTPPTSLMLEPDCPTPRCNSMLFFLCIYPQRLDKCESPQQK